MTQELLIRSEGDYFLVPDQNNQTRQIPKINRRDISLDQKALVSDDRKIDISVSSDKPYKRWWYYEILEHTKDAVALERMNDGAMSLFNHRRDDYLGVIEKAWLENGKLYNTIRFGHHQRAEEIVKSINEGIIKNVSIGYRVDELVLFKKSDDDLNTYKATKWTPFESSFVTVPADATVGVGRQYFDLSPQRKDELSKWEELEQQVNKLAKDSQELFDYVLAVEETSMGDENKSSTSLEVNEADVRTQERERVAGIYGLIKKYGHSEIGQRAIDEELSIVEARSLYLDKVKSEDVPVAKTQILHQKKLIGEWIAEVVV